MGRSSACPLHGTISRALKTLHRHALPRGGNAHSHALILRAVPSAPWLAEQAGTGVTGRSWFDAEPPPPSKCFPPRGKAWSLMKHLHGFKQQPDGDSALFRCRQLPSSTAWPGVMHTVKRRFSPPFFRSAAGSSPEHGAHNSEQSLANFGLVLLRPSHVLSWSVRAECLMFLCGSSKTSRVS